MDIAKVKAYIAAMRPPQGEAVKGYIAAAVRALGGRSDAGLSRTMGVPAPTIASWKKRGVVPEDHFRWFTTTLGEKIIAYRAHMGIPDPVSDAAVVKLLVRTGGNPLGLEADGVRATPYVLPGLFALSAFLYQTQSAGWAALSEEDQTERLADLLEGAMLEEASTVPLPLDFKRGR